MRWLRGAGAALVLGAIVFGAPVALLAWGRYVLPLGLARPDDGSVLLVALTGLGWLAWAAFTFATLTEAIGLVTRREPRRLPLLGGLQQFSAGLLMAALALLPSAAESSVTPVVAVADPAPASPGPSTDDPQGPAYVVVAGDDLWTVSERLLGEGSRWRELAEANPELLGDPTRELAAGTRLLLPASSAVAPREVVVRRGDTLSGLALEHLGAAGRWPRIAKANRHLISDPDHIEIGWRLRLPDTTAAPGPVVAARPTPDPEANPAAPDGGEEPVPQGGPAADVAPDPHVPGSTRNDDDGEPTPHVGEPTPDVIPGSTRYPGDDGGSTPDVIPGPTRDPGDDGELDSALPLVGTLSTVAAAAIIGALEGRRILRLRERPVGRRLIPVAEPAARLRAAVGSRERPDRTTLLDAALRTVGQHCYQQESPRPELARIVLGEDQLTLEWAEAAGQPPDGFSGDRRRWIISSATPPPRSEHPCPHPAVVSLGTSASGELVLIDIERSRVLGVSADTAELRQATVAALAVELACAPWAAETQLVVAGPDAGLIAVAGGERVRVLDDPSGLVAELRAVVQARRSGLGGEPLQKLRVDPDRAAAVAPVVFCLLGEVDPELPDELDRLLAGPATGVAVLLAAPPAAAAQWVVGGDPYAPTGHLAGSPATLLAHCIPEPVRAGLAALFGSVENSDTEPAPWWGGADSTVTALPPRTRRAEEPVDIVKVIAASDHPQLLLIGPADLRRARGQEPERSRQQLLEMCAWLLAHPGSTATEMARGMALAEGTRRSNLSRLRSWLGVSPDGEPYLPDAYSGRIRLHPAVGCDWHQLRMLLRPGIDRLSDRTLMAALDMVRGAPLADAAPGQWHWAEPLRTDIASAIRDLGLVLTERALARAQIDLARWAIERAAVVAPADERLLGARIRVEHRAGNLGEVTLLVHQVTEQARALGVDLLPETVLLCQEVIEGRIRAREA